MSESRPPSPSHRSGQPLRVLTGVFVAMLAAAIVSLPIWIASVPEPAVPPAVRPTERRAVSAATSKPAPQPTRGAVRTERRADGGGKPARADPVPIRGAPVVERRWRQGETRSIPSQPVVPLEFLPEATHSGIERSPATRRRRVRQFGGTSKTEDAVEAGLAWLAAHQEPDGTWDRFEFARHCPSNDPCPGAAVRAQGYLFRPGLTGLVLLAFLGAGYTDQQGPYQDAVGRAVSALLRTQMAHGGFGSDERVAGYNDALGTFALSEYYAMTADQRVVAPLDRAVQRLVLSQQELGGWDYVPRGDSGRNDTSITAWVAQALQACVAAGIHVPRRALIRAALHFARATAPDGRVRYSDAGTGFKIDQSTLQPIHRYGPAMLAAGLVSEQLLGWRFDCATVRRQQALLSQEPPSASLLMGGDPTQLHSYYYWYYGTIAAFQAGGESWERWNAGLRDAILPLQERRRDATGHKLHAYGSWPPFGPRWGKWGRQGSRVYTTALCVLTLEIYYRHTPAYLEHFFVLSDADWREFLAEAKRWDRRRAIQVLTEMRLEVAEPVLVELLRDPDDSLARTAAVALVAFDSPVGRPVLERQRAAVPAWEREVLSGALRRIAQIESLPPGRGVVRDFDETSGIATLTLSRAYAGMVADIVGDGRVSCQLLVTKRFSGIDLVLAKLLGEPNGRPPQTGDPIITR